MDNKDLILISFEDLEILFRKCYKQVYKGYKSPEEILFEELNFGKDWEIPKIATFVNYNRDLK